MLGFSHFDSAKALTLGISPSHTRSWLLGAGHRGGGEGEERVSGGPFVLEENPFRVLIDTVMKKKEGDDNIDETKSEKRVVLVGVDAILFEHMLWLLYNDCSSLFQLNIREIIDFYTQDY